MPLDEQLFNNHKCIRIKLHNQNLHNFVKNHFKDEGAL